MNLLKFIFINIFLFFTPLVIAAYQINPFVGLLAFLFFWSILFFRILNRLWKFLFDVDLFKVIKKFYINKNINSKIKSKTPFIFFVLFLFFLPIVVLVQEENFTEDQFYLYFSATALFSWGFLSVYFFIKLANYLSGLMTIQLEEIFPNVNIKKTLFLKIFLFTLLPTLGLISLTLTQFTDDGTYDIYFGTIFLFLSIFVVWICRILYKFISAITKDGKLIFVIIFIAIILYIIAAISSPSSTSTNEQKAKETICRVAPEMGGC